MAEPITPPDQIGAGVASPQPPGPDAASLMSQLRQAPLPPQDASLLSAMPRQTPGQAYAQALAGGHSVMTGQPNPVMQQQQAQQQQMAQYAQLQQRIMEQRMRREEGVLSLSKDLLNSDSEEARMVGARGIVGHLKASGQPVPESLVKSLATKRMDTKELGEVFREVAMGLDDATITLRHPNIDAATLQQARASVKNDDTRKLLGLPTARQEAQEIANLKIAEAKAMEADHPELVGAPPELKLQMDMEHRRLNAGKGYREGTTESKQAAFERAYGQYKAVEQRKLDLAEQESRRKALKDERLEQWFQAFMSGGKPGGPLRGGGFDVSAGIGPSGPSLKFDPPKPVSGETMNQLTAVGAMSDALARVGAIRDDPKLRRVVEEYIGPYASMWSATQSATPGGMLGKVPPSVVRLQADLKTFENYMLRLRSGAAVTEAEMPRLEAELTKMNLPPDQFWTMFDRSLKDQEILKRRTVQLALSGSQKALAVAMELGLIDQTGKPTIDVKATAPPAGASPLKPAVPPGAKMENGELVSESGKYVWKGGKWTPR